jgi:hypothetical protein
VGPVPPKPVDEDHGPDLAYRRPAKRMTQGAE